MTRNKEAGQALIFGVVALGLLLLGFAGLGIDMGYLRYQKRLQQGAADSAAIAAASDLPPAYGGITAAAQNAASASGFTAGATNLEVCPPPAPAAAVGSVALTVNNPPCSGPHLGDFNYVEIYIAKVQPTYFMHSLGITSETVTARAVATTVSGGTNSGCLYTLGAPSSGIEGVAVTGSAVLNAPTCGIVDNGNYDPTGGALTVKAGTFGVAGTCSGSGCGKGSVTCTSGQTSCPALGEPAGADPLAYLTPPPQPAASASCPNKACNLTTAAKSTVTLQPGTYSSITIGKNSTVTLSPGIYYIDGSGGVSFNGTATVSGSGVMFYFTGSASINAVGGGNQVANIQLSAPTSGTYAGILMYQDPADTNVGGKPNSGPTLGGDDTSFFDGALYFPSDQLTFFGNSKGTGFKAGIVVTDSIALSGNPTVNLLGSAGLPPGVNLIQNAVLVE